MRGDHGELRRRRIWVQRYAETKNASLVCRRCGIRQPTLRLWWKRFLAKGDAGLISLSRRPHHSPHRVLDQNRLALILRLRDERKLGPTRIQAELLRHHAIRWSTATIWKVLHSHARAPLVRKRPPESPRRYSRPLPGDRVQVDTMKVSPGPLPVHRHSQQTDWVEFYSTVDIDDPLLRELLAEWQFFYNWHRPHSALGGKTPMERCCELLDRTPSQEEVENQYQLKQERGKVREFSTDQQLAALKGCP